MKYVFKKIKEVHNVFPSVVTHIDCVDDLHLKQYYEKSVFHLFSKKDNRLVYLLPTNSIFDRMQKEVS